MGLFCPFIGLFCPFVGLFCLFVGLLCPFCRALLLRKWVLKLYVPILILHCWSCISLFYHWRWIFVYASLIPSGSAAGAVHCRRRSSPTIFTTENENTSFTHTECLYTPVLFLPAPPLVLCIAGGDHLQRHLRLHPHPRSAEHQRL